MKEYHKINTLWKRDDKNKIIVGDYTLPEFEYLSENTWIGTEKFDGTNIRVIWNGKQVVFKGKSDNSNTLVSYSKLDAKLHEIFANDILSKLYPDTPMCLYGEGFGAGIQKGGGNYISNGVGFTVFDIMIDGWWLKRSDVLNIVQNLGLLAVPLVFSGNLANAALFVKNGFSSICGNCEAEGLVLQPKEQLFSRKGERIITKIKQRDYKQLALS